MPLTGVVAEGVVMDLDFFGVEVENGDDTKLENDFEKPGEFLRLEDNTGLSIDKEPLWLMEIQY